MKKQTATSANKSPNTANRDTNANNKAAQQDSKLADFFHDELKDIYWAEKHLLKAIPKMQKAVSSEELSSALGEHLEATKEHVSRLEQVFEILGHKAQAKKCEAMEGITKEGDSIVEDTEDGTATRDVGVIMAAQKVEHYEIATYGALHQLALTLGQDEIAGILETTLNEEKDADEKLTNIAENHVNYEASVEEND